MYASTYIRCSPCLCMHVSRCAAYYRVETAPIEDGKRHPAIPHVGCDGFKDGNNAVHDLRGLIYR